MAEVDDIIDEGLAAKINIRSEQVQDVLSAPPRWMLRWGSTVVFVLVLLILFFAWFIKYPDTVVGDVKITTANPPIQQVSYASGKIIFLGKKDNQKIKKGETIAIIENPLSISTGHKITGYLQAIKQSLAKGAKSIPVVDSLAVLGDLQAGFNKLNNLVKTYNSMAGDPFFANDIQNLNTQIGHYNKYIELSDNQIKLADDELKNAAARYKSFKKLFENGVITKMEFLGEESKYLLAQQQLRDQEKNKSQNMISQTEYKKQANELRFQQHDKLFQTTNSIDEEVHDLEDRLQKWELQYVIKAPFDGTLSYLDSWYLNRYVKQGDAMFTMVPENQHYIALALIPGANFGKIQTGQPVNLRIENYPYNESGELTGKVKSISLASGVSNKYRVEISLNNGLTSTYKKQFKYQPDMTGQALVMTSDLSMLDRIFFTFKQLVSR